MKTALYAQTHNNKPTVKGSNHQLSLNVNTPMGGYLKDISNIGFGIEYGWSKGRFGKMHSRPEKPVSFTFHAGIDHYLGQKEKVGNDSYKYKGITYFHLFGGAIYNISNIENIILTTGPSLELYDGKTEFGFGVNLSVSFYLNKCRNMGITPNITFMKQGKSEAVFSGGFRLNYTL